VVDEIIATVADDNGDITSAILESGSVMPDGTALNDITGEITVVDPTTLIPGSYTIEITTEDVNGGTTMHMVTLVFNENPVIVNINSGGGELIFADITYAADQFFVGTSIENGTYKVTLHFVELYWGAPGLGSAGGIGDRVFDVLIEGVVEIDDYDIFADVGALFATEKEFNVTLTDGMLNIDFLSSVDNAKISAFEIEKIN